MAQIQIPFLNPLNFVEVDRAELPQYQSRAMDDYWQSERLSSWEQLPDGPYYQPFVPQDNIALQFQNNTGQLIGTVVSCDQKIQQDFILQQLQQNVYQPDFFIYQMAAALNVLPSNRKYFMIIQLGGTGRFLLSEGFDLRDTQPDTLLLEYTHRQYYGNMIFETGIAPSIRIKGSLKLKPPPSKDTVYEDQVLDMVMVQSKPYRLWELMIINVPDWMIDKLNWVLGCSNLRINGKYYTKNDGAKLEIQDVQGNGTRATYKIEMREQIMRNSKLVDTVLNTDEALTLILNSNSKGFADTSTDGSQDIVQFYDVE